MKNFPSALIKQKNTKGGLGNNLGSTLKNIGTQALGNIFGGGKNANITIENINSKFEDGYERLEVQHEIDAININKFTNITNSSNNDISNRIYNTSLSNISMNYNMLNGNNNSNIRIEFEDPFLYTSSLFSVINNYKYILNYSIPSIIDHIHQTDNKDEYAFQVVHGIVSPSLFNPYNGVNFNYITEGVPIMNGDSTTNISVKNGLNYDDTGIQEQNDNGNNDTITLSSGVSSGTNSDYDITDCSIRKLVELSNQSLKLSKDGKQIEDQSASPLGLATYRYIDFMFCKDLGKISNNHLITLRKFGHPIGDNIFQEAIPIANNNSLFKANYDIGRLITWFGNEDNKLEDICKYNYNASWKPFTAAIQQMNSQQQDGSSDNLSDGFVNKIANAFSASNNKLVSQGFSQHYGLLQWGANKLSIPILKDKTPQNYYDWTVLGNYDQNRIYEPQDVIWDTHKYEGKLTFNQEITLTFRYTLRSYANINPKSAFLDLIGNIMTVTYRRGSFWGGESKIVGPQGNNSIYDTSNAFIDKSFDKLGGVWKMLRDGSLTPGIIMGWLGNIMDSIKDAMGTAGNALIAAGKDAATAIGADSGEKTQREKDAQQKAVDLKDKAVTWLEDSNSKYGWTNAIKGMFKNQLGRPAIYAFNSLLTGDAVGPWHLTIGNPLNPIMSMGNMIMTSSEVQHLGPLGLDDFPTEIKVTVTLKHGRPRDSVEIQKMYTKGRESIYKPMNLIDVDKFVTNPYAFGDVVNISNEKMSYDEAENLVNEYAKQQDEANKNNKKYKSMDQKEKNKLIKAKINEPSALNKLLRTI